MRPTCAVAPDLWFSEDYGPALRVCASCPLREPCLEEALACGAPWGVWGGTTPAQRRRMKPRRARVVACGTPAGYERHRATGDPPCGPCRAAHAERKRDYRARKAVR